MSRPITLGFHHITMVAANARRTLAFYHELLGLQIGRAHV